MTRVTGIVLAAGLSRRMGQQNKLLLPVHGKPIIRCTVEAYIAFCDEVMVVTGHEADMVRDCLSGLDLRFVHNPEFAQGQATSVAAGLRAVLEADCILVGLGDQPRLIANHLRELVSAYFELGGTKIAVPHDGTERGNPIAIPGAMVAQMLADKQNPGCGKFTREHPDLVAMIPFEERAYFDDVDTPDDYVALTSPTLAKVCVQ